MEQADATGHARAMAEAIAAIYQNAGVRPAQDRIAQFHGAVFSQAFEFIPNGAVATVITLVEDDGLPLLVAVEGQQLYKLSFGEFQLQGNETPATICEILNLDPANCVVSIEAVYHPAPIGAPTRVTKWEFRIGNAGLSVQSRFNPDQEVDEAEVFARTLACTMGWSNS